MGKRFQSAKNSLARLSHRILKVTVRTEDFKRTGSMKVARV